ncbi:MAG: hypothetical protein NT012_02375 [Candidatus Nealsonbacteria bacterium]|nr:hypothetical protein [Candidatus Nealsonbacteria bacterium]
MNNKLNKRSTIKGIIFPAFIGAIAGALGVSMRRGGASLLEIILVAVAVALALAVVGWIFSNLWKSKQK